MYKIFSLMVLIIMASGCTESKEVQMVKKGKMSSCPDATVEQLIDNFMESPTWESDESTDGKTFVNIEGDMTYAERPVNATMQFIINKKKGTFEFKALEFNSVPQMNIMALGLIKKMCQEVRRKS
jgi:hypothetical protein